MNIAIPSPQALESSAPNKSLKSVSGLRSVFMAAMMALVAHAEKAEAATTVKEFDSGVITTVGTGPNDMIFTLPPGVGLVENPSESYLLGITLFNIQEIGVNQNATLTGDLTFNIYTASGPSNGSITLTAIPSLLQNGNIIWTGAPQEITETYDVDGVPTNGSFSATWLASASTIFNDGDSLTTQVAINNLADQNASFTLGSGPGGFDAPRIAIDTGSVPEPGIAGLVGSGLAAAVLRRRRKEKSQ